MDNVPPLRAALRFSDLSSLSVSSVAPIFSVAAAGPAMAQAAGVDVPIAILLIAIPFILSSWIFLSLNQHFPNAGGSYHWSRRILGRNYSNFQAWIVLMAYFWSIPPILLPAAQFTLGALGLPSTTTYSLALAGFWALFAGWVLLQGASITARVTQVFLIIEVISVAFMAVLGYSHWGPAALGAGKFSLSHVQWVGVVVCMVVAATIVDGWEIDTYAAEESHKPRHAPGWGGVVGACSVVAYYLLIWPLLLHQLPLAGLQQSSNSLGLWAAHVAPNFVPWMQIAVIASTAGSLWLTTFILSRALFAMGRDRIMPSPFTRLNRAHAPHWAIVLPIVLSMLIVALQLFFPSTRSLFDLVLSAAGFFLVAEFLLDGINMAYFLASGHHQREQHQHQRLSRHRHWALFLASLFVVFTLASVELLFLYFGPQYIAPGIDSTVLVFLALGVAYVLYLRWHRHQRQGTFVFELVEEKSLS
ncbi:APC family permease [Acidithiobacillus sp. AMEEHan]|uniref:APC family permease n=1 Tax=Acidithiobacillus sp. AMEEHan TaxID=2994951 RepID=UPI0027E48827|nr:APC family permease [Acidithiobacillus sp. AMEEHan]